LPAHLWTLRWRGGDQVVVKNGENISFFGGKTRELEKRTKVKARVIAYALRELIDQASDVMIMGHENCDMTVWERLWEYTGWQEQKQGGPYSFKQLKSYNRCFDIKN